MATLAHGASIATEVKTKLWLEIDGHFVIGEAGLHLLLGIERSGSLTGAVRAIGRSYRHARGYLRHAEATLGVPLVSSRPGKGAAWGTMLTADGRLMLERLREIRARMDEPRSAR